MKTLAYQAIKYYMRDKGLKMAKELSSGLFHTTWDNRTVYSLDDMNELIKEGFLVDQDMGIFIFNAIISYSEVKKNKE